MAVDTLFNDVRLLLQSGSLTNAATSSPASVGSSGVTGGTALTFASDGIITASSISLDGPTTLATLETVVTPTWAEYSKIASMLGLSLNAISPGVIGIYSFATVTPTLVGSLNTAQSGEITLIAEYLVSGASTEIKLTAIPLSGTTTTTTVSAASAVGILPATLVLGGPPAIPVPVPGGSATVARIQAPRAQYSQQQIASLRNTNPSNSIIYASTPVSVTATAIGVSYTHTVSNPAGRTVDDVLSELALGIAQKNGAVLMAETGYYTGAEARASLRLTFTPISSDVDNWAYSFVGMPYATAIYFLEGVYGANPPLPQISTATYTFTPGSPCRVSLTAYGVTTTGFTTDMPAFVAAVSSALSSLATVSGIYPFAGQCIVYVTGAIGVEFTLTSTIGANATVPSGIATLKAARVTDKRRYIDLGAAVEYPSLPWPTTSIPGGGVGGQLPTDVWLALGFESGSATDLSTFAHTKLTQDQVTLPTTGSRTSDGYAEAANGATVLNYSADLDELNGLTGLTIEFDFYIPTNNQFGYFMGPTGSLYMTADTTAGNGTVTIVTNGWIGGLSGDITFSAGAWHHIAFVGGATDCRAFVDGTQQFAAGHGIGTTDFSSIIGAVTTLGILNISDRADLAVCSGLRLDNVLITKREKYTANFTPPGPITGGGTGWGTLPADVIFAVNAESNGNDVAQFGLSASVSGTATIQASGSRTGDGYLRNTDGAQYADACFGYTPSSGFQAAWGAAQSMTLEFDLRVDTGAYLSGQIMGIHGQYASLSSGGSTGIILSGSPLQPTACHAEITADAWHHIAFVADYNGGSRVIRCYLDGVQQGIAESTVLFSFEDYPAPTSIGLLQLLVGFIGNGALKGGLDNVVITTRAKYTSTFTPGTTFAEIVGYTPPPSGVDVSIAGYNDLDAITGAGTFNTQLTAPDAYFFSVATLDDFGGEGNAYTVDGNSINFTGPRTLANTTCTGTFVRGTPQNFDSTVTLDDTTAVSTFYCDVPVEWTGDSTLSDSTCFGIHALMAPSMLSGDSSSDDVMSSAAFSIIDPIYFRLSATVPAATLASSATQFFVNAQVPAATLLADVASYDNISLNASVPSASLSSWMGMRLSSQLPRVTMLAETTVPNTLRLDATLPGITGQGNILTGRVFSVSSSVPVVSISSWTGLQLAASMPIASSAGNVVVGGAFRVSPGLVPMATLSAGASSMNVLRLDGVVPVASRAGWAALNRNIPSARMLGSITPVVAVTRVAYSFTLSNSAMTRYPAYPFIQVLRMGNAYYGVAEDGLYELGGTTDNGISIPWSWETCMADFGQAEKKTVVSAYLGGYVPQNMTYTIKAGDVPTGTNAHTTTATAVLRNHRQKFGIGRKSRFFAFGLSATQGRVAIESIEFEMAKMSRRV